MKRKQHWKTKSSSGYAVNVGRVSVWKLHWFGPSRKIYINLLVLSIMLNDVIEHVYRKIYMITNVARLEMHVTSLSMRPQMVGDIDMVWLLRGFARSTSEEPIWWFFDDIMYSLRSIRYYIVGRAFGSRLFSDKVYTSSFPVAKSYIYEYNYNINVGNIIYNGSILKQTSCIVRGSAALSYPLEISNNSKFTDMLYLSSHIRNHYNFLNKFAVLIFNIASIMSSTLYTLYSTSTSCTYFSCYSTRLVFMLLRKSLFRYSRFSAFIRPLVMDTLSSGVTAGKVYGLGYLLSSKVLPPHIFSVICKGYMDLYLLDSIYSYNSVCTLNICSYSNCAAYFKKFCILNVGDVLNINISSYSRSVLLSSGSYSHKNIFSYVGSMCVPYLNMHDLFFTNLYKLLDNFLYFYGKTSYYFGYNFYNVVPKNIYILIVYMRKIFIILYLMLQQSSTSGLFKPYRFDLVHTKQKVRYSKDFTSKLGIDIINSGSSTITLNRDKNFGLIRWGMKIKKHRFEHYQVIVWNSYIQSLHNLYSVVRSLIHVFYDNYVNIKYLYFNNHIKFSSICSSHCSSYVWSFVIHKYLQNSKFMSIIYSNHRSMFKSYKSFRNYMCTRLNYNINLLSMLSILMRKVRRHPTVGNRWTRSEPNTAAKILLTFFSNNIELDNSLLCELNVSYSYSCTNMYMYIQSKLGLNIKYSKFSVYGKFIKDLTTVGLEFRKKYFIDTKINIFFMYNLYSRILDWYGSVRDTMFYIINLVGRINKLLYRYRLLLNTLLSVSGKRVVTYTHCVHKVKLLAKLVVQCKYMLFVIVFFGTSYKAMHSNIANIKSLVSHLECTRNLFKSIGFIGINFSCVSRYIYMYKCMRTKLVAYNYFIYYASCGKLPTHSITNIFGSIYIFRVFCMKVTLWLTKLRNIEMLSKRSYMYITNDLQSSTNFLVGATVVNSSMYLFERDLIYYGRSYRTYLRSDDVVGYNLLYIYRNSKFSLYRHSSISTKVHSSVFTAMCGIYVGRWYDSFCTHQYRMMRSVEEFKSYVDIINCTTRIYKYMSYVYNFMHSLRVFLYEFSSKYTSGANHNISRDYLNMNFIFSTLYNNILLKIRYQLYILNVLLRNKIKQAILLDYLGNNVCILSISTNNRLHDYSGIFFNAMKNYRYNYYNMYYNFHKNRTFLKLPSFVSGSILFWNNFRLNIIRHSIFIDRIKSSSARSVKYMLSFMLSQGLKFDYNMSVLVASSYSIRSRAKYFKKLLNSIHGVDTIRYLRYISARVCNIFKKNNKGFIDTGNVSFNKPTLSFGGLFRSSYIYATTALSPIFLQLNTMRDSKLFTRSSILRSELWGFILKSRRRSMRSKYFGSKYIRAGKLHRVNKSMLSYWKYSMYLYMLGIFKNGIFFKYTCLIYTCWIFICPNFFKSYKSFMYLFVGDDFNCIHRISIDGANFINSLNSNQYRHRYINVTLLFGNIHKSILFVPTGNTYTDSLIFASLDVFMLCTSVSNEYIVSSGLHLTYHLSSVWYNSIFLDKLLFSSSNLYCRDSSDSVVDLKFIYINKLPYPHKLLVLIKSFTMFFLIFKNKFKGSILTYLLRLVKLQYIYQTDNIYRSLILSYECGACFIYNCIAKSYIYIYNSYVSNLYVNVYMYIAGSFTYKLDTNSSLNLVYSKCAIYNTVFNVLYYYSRASYFGNSNLYFRSYTNNMLMRRLYKIHKIYYLDGDKRKRPYKNAAYHRRLIFMLNYVYSSGLIGFVKLYQGSNARLLSDIRHWRYLLYPYSAEFRRNRYLGKYNYNSIPKQISSDWSYFMYNGLWSGEYWYNRAVYDRSYMNTLLEFSDLFNLFRRVYMPLMFEDFLFMYLIYMFHMYINVYILNFFCPSLKTKSINYLPQIFTNEDHLDPPIIDPDFVCKYIKTAIKKEDTLYEAISEVRVWISRSVHKFKTFSYYYRKGFRSKLVDHKLNYKIPLVRSVKIEISGRVNERRRTVVRVYKVGWKVTTSRIKDKPLQYSSTQGQSRYGVFGIKVWVFFHHQPVRGYIK